MSEMVVATEAAGPLRRGWKWLLALGILQSLVGLIALGAPIAVSAVTAIFFGWLLLISGVFQIVHAFQCTGWRGFLLHLLGGVLALVAGGWIAFVPLRGALVLALILATFLIVQGIVRVVLALRVRPMPGWLGWLISGVAAVLLGGFMFSRPGAALWIIGFVIGFDLLLSGLTEITVAWRLRGAQAE